MVILLFGTFTIYYGCIISEAVETPEIGNIFPEFPTVFSYEIVEGSSKAFSI